MALLRQKVDHYEKTAENTWSGTPTELNYATNVQVTTGLGNRKDSWTFSLLNYNNTYFSSGGFLYDASADSGSTTYSKGIQDKVNIYFWSGTGSETTSDLMMDGIITQVNETMDTNTRKIHIKGANWIEVLFDTQFPIDKEGTADVIIQEMLRLVNNANKQFSSTDQRFIEWYPDNISSLLSTSYTTDYKFAYEMLEELSSNEYTGDGLYIYFIVIGDGNNTPGGNPTVAGQKYLVWKKKPSTVTGTITEGTGTEDIKISYRTDEIINAVIFFCGKDLRQRSIHGVYADYTSIGKHGAKWHYEGGETKEVFDNLIRDERNKKGDAAFGDDGYPNAYPYTFLFDSRNTAGVKSGSKQTAGGDAAFNSALRTEARWIGQEIVARYVTMWRNPRHFASVRLRRPASGVYNLGELWQFSLPSFNVTPTNLTGAGMRLVEIQHSIDSVNLVFEEDIKGT